MVVRLIANMPAGLTDVSATPDRGNCTAAAAANNSVEANAHTEGDFANLRITIQPLIFGTLGLADFLPAVAGLARFTMRVGTRQAHSAVREQRHASAAVVSGR